MPSNRKPVWTDQFALPGYYSGELERRMLNLNQRTRSVENQIIRHAADRLAPQFQYFGQLKSEIMDPLWNRIRAMKQRGRRLDGHIADCVFNRVEQLTQPDKLEFYRQYPVEGIDYNTQIQGMPNEYDQERREQDGEASYTANQEVFTGEAITPSPLPRIGVPVSPRFGQSTPPASRPIGRQLPLGRPRQPAPVIRQPIAVPPRGGPIPPPTEPPGGMGLYVCGYVVYHQCFYGQQRCGVQIIRCDGSREPTVLPGDAIVLRTFSGGPEVLDAVYAYINSHPMCDYGACDEIPGEPGTEPSLEECPEPVCCPPDPPQYGTCETPYVASLVPSKCQECPADVGESAKTGIIMTDWESVYNACHPPTFPDVGSDEPEQLEQVLPVFDLPICQ